ncbi:MAG: DNA-directed RNA polymerase subunit K [Methanopyraceae archaeon]
MERMEELTRFEVTRILGARALQISMGSPVMVEVEEGESPLEIAKKEFEEGVIPVVVIRER